MTIIVGRFRINSSNSPLFLREGNANVLGTLEQLHIHQMAAQVIDVTTYSTTKTYLQIYCKLLCYLNLC